MKKLLLIVLLLSAGCGQKAPESVPAVVTHTDRNGTVYTLVRAEGPRGTNGGFAIELWAKEGVPTNTWIYRREVRADGESRFYRMEP